MNTQIGFQTGFLAQTRATAICRSAQYSALLFALLFSACGGHSYAPVADAPLVNAPPPTIPTPSGPAVLTGSEAALASSALVRTQDRPVAATEIVRGFLLTRLLVVLTPTTTVGQVNAAARAVGATAITSSASDSLAVVMSIPRQQDVAALQRLAKTMRVQAGIAFAWPGQMARVSVLPELQPGLAVSALGLSHLLGTRFPQAWNARHAAPADCLTRSVHVYVFDIFGDVSLRPKFLDEIAPSSFIFDARGVSSGALTLGQQAGHGYDVALTMAANFDANAPTGADPFKDCVLITQAEAGGYELIDTLRSLTAAIAADADPHVILTTSLNFVDDGFCGANGDEICDAATVVSGAKFLHGALQDRVEVAAVWAALHRSLNLQSKVLITQSAGNVDPLPGGFLASTYLGFRSVSFSSATALATHLSDLQTLLTAKALWSTPTPGLPDLTYSNDEATQLVQELQSRGQASSIGAGNLLIVDSGSNHAKAEDITQSEFDFLGADVRAVGEGVVTIGGALLPDGTSFSAPTVAGLAAYLWNLSPALSVLPPAATANLIRNTSVSTANSPIVPLVDAYAATLQLDTVQGCCSGSSFAPIRLGIMDVDGDGRFTSADLQQFATAFGLGNPSTPLIPANPDYSRFDLNGDGFTGSILIAPFSLDAALDSNGRTRIAAVNEDIEGYPITFNEAALSDLQVLCYYAYSLLYTAETAGQGNPVRTSLLGPDKCIGMQMNLALTQDIPSNGSGSLSIKLQHPDGGGVLAPAAGVPYRLTTTGGIASPASGITDAQGNATANVTPSQNATSIQVVAVATAPTSGTVLAQGAASAAIVQGTETSRSDYAGGFVRTCRGLTFPGRSPPPPVVTSGSATATFSVNKGQANFATVVAPTDIFFQLGRILTLAGVPENFDGFTDAGNGFVWTVTGSRSAATLTMSVEEIGNNCTFVFDGQVVP